MSRVPITANRQEAQVKYQNDNNVGYNPDIVRRVEALLGHATIKPRIAKGILETLSRDPEDRVHAGCVPEVVFAGLTSIRLLIHPSSRMPETVVSLRPEARALLEAVCAPLRQLQ